MYSWMNYSSLVKTIRYMTKFDDLLSEDEDDGFQQLLQELTEHNIKIADLVEVVRQVRPACNDMVVDCQWKSNIVACERIMSLRPTDDGYCCSLVVAALDNDVENRSSSTVYDYGVHSALRIILDPNLNDNALSPVSIDGFKILLHNKDEFSDVIERGFIVGSGYENFVALNSFSVSYTPAVQAVSFERRQCYVDGEGSLRYSQNVNYTRSSCLFECRAEKILEACHCLPYFIKVSIPAPTCKLQAYPCVTSVYVQAIFTAPVTANCMCPANCKDQWFTTEISSAPLSPTGFPATRTFKRISKNKNMDANYSVKLIGLRVFFKYNAGESFSMDAPFGNKELLASVGGILGLCLGFSIISAIELCYFLCCDWCFRQKRSMPKTIANLAMSNPKLLRKQGRRPPPVIKVLPDSTVTTIAWPDTISK
ncbi:pickpocket protein 28-like isoform X2 [Daphnia carinata]|uniref:pickpocket protein 28-like isoform X2 n=1 Tax=Daphnia carinata TaxID=120202 RepID=UPI00257952AD|nr:pickpocket protein 28-like isoform X2 [Daphnia carinata]